jgi:hypothetical protein
LGRKSYSGGNLTVAVSAATTGADDTTQHLIAGSGNWPATPNVVNTTQPISGLWLRYYFVGQVPANATQLGFLCMVKLITAASRRSSRPP